MTHTSSQEAKYLAETADATPHTLSMMTTRIALQRVADVQLDIARRKTKLWDWYSTTYPSMFADHMIQRESMHQAPFLARLWKGVLLVLTDLY